MEEEACGWLGMIFSDPKDMVVFCFQVCLDSEGRQHQVGPELFFPI